VDLPLWFEIGTYVVLTIILAVDVVIAYRRPHVPSTKESALWIAFYVSLALIFAGLMFVIGNAEQGTQFITGWLTEYSLSIDNLFVFLLIMGSFKVPKKYQQPILMVGIILSLVFRGIFILLGVALIERFSWIFYIFGAFLVWTAYQQAFTGHDDEEQTESFIVRLMRKVIPITEVYDGSKMRTVIDGKRMWTPVVLVICALGVTNVIFALDSIPAIFGITTDAFLVFTTNVFALMGLRQLYFLLGDLVDKLQYLKYGIAFILAFIGVNLVFHAMHANELPFINGGHAIEWAPDIPTWVSLLVILGSMTVAVIASLLKIRADLKAGILTEDDIDPDLDMPEAPDISELGTAPSEASADGAPLPSTAADEQAKP